MHRFREYKAPADDQGVFADPPLIDAARVVQNNQSRIAGYPNWLQQLRQSGQQEMVLAAKKYTSAYTDVDWVDSRDASSILMAGHQPALFHPGVWFKNFALSRIAHQQNALAINMVVDNDVSAGGAVRVPHLDRTTGRLGNQMVEFNRGSEGIPYEQTEIRDRDWFDSFGSRLQQAVLPISDDPAVVALWPHARAAIRRCGFAGCALAQARHALEAELGQRSLEIPVGVLSRGQAFNTFVSRLIFDLDRFVEIYNRSLAIYRTAHGIRSSAHPVPELSVDRSSDGEHWVEAPLWVYGDKQPQRRPVWVRKVGNELEIADRQGMSRRIDARDLGLAARQLGETSDPEFKLRPRALLTTMFARMVLSDLFLHGIGGGKYDQLGDMIIREFLGVEPPEFMVLSATVRLPSGRQEGSAPSVEMLKRQLRDVRFQPERFASQVEMDQSLIQHKQAILETRPATGSRKAWHDELVSINERLSASLANVRDELQQQLNQAIQRESDRNLLQSREFSFAIHPLDSLVTSFDRMLSKV